MTLTQLNEQYNTFKAFVDAKKDESYFNALNEVKTAIENHLNAMGVMISKSNDEANKSCTLRPGTDKKLSEDDFTTLADCMSAAKSACENKNAVKLNETINTTFTSPRYSLLGKALLNLRNFLNTLSTTQKLLLALTPAIPALGLIFLVSKKTDSESNSNEAKTPKPREDAKNTIPFAKQHHSTLRSLFPLVIPSIIGIAPYAGIFAKASAKKSMTGADVREAMNELATNLTSSK